MSSARVQKIVQGAPHARALSSGGLGAFASLLAIGWALFGYNVPSAVDVTSSRSQSRMLLQVGLAFVTLLGSGLMLATYTAPGGTVNILGSLGTLIIGVYYSSGLADAARADQFTSLPLRFSSF